MFLSQLCSVKICVMFKFGGIKGISVPLGGGVWLILFILTLCFCIRLRALGFTRTFAMVVPVGGYIVALAVAYGTVPGQQYR